MLAYYVLQIGIDISKQDMSAKNALKLSLFVIYRAGIGYCHVIHDKMLVDR